MLKGENMSKAICRINIGLKNQTVYIQNKKYKYNNKHVLKSYEVPF